MGINEEEDDLFIDKKNYRKKIRNLQKSIRPIDNSPDYNEIVNKDLYHSLIQYNNNNYSDFIHDFNKIHTPNNNSLLHPPDYNNSLLHPPDYNNSLLHPPYYNNSLLHPPVRHSFSFTPFDFATVFPSALIRQ
jgi:hypothetical protein